jgi:hypothetical protein
LTAAASCRCASSRTRASVLGRIFAPKYGLAGPILRIRPQFHISGKIRLRRRVYLKETVSCDRFRKLGRRCWRD